MGRGLAARGRACTRAAALPVATLRRHGCDQHLGVSHSLAPPLSAARLITHPPSSRAHPLDTAARRHKKYGIVREGGQMVYREWAPGAVEAELIGDFNGWQGQAMTRDDFGTWSIRCGWAGWAACLAASWHRQPWGCVPAIARRACSTQACRGWLRCLLFRSCHTSIYPLH